MGRTPAVVGYLLASAFVAAPVEASWPKQLASSSSSSSSSKVQSHLTTTMGVRELKGRRRLQLEGIATCKAVASKAREFNGDCELAYPDPVEEDAATRRLDGHANTIASKGGDLVFMRKICHSISKRHISNNYFYKLKSDHGAEAAFCSSEDYGMKHRM